MPIPFSTTFGTLSGNRKDVDINFCGVDFEAATETDSDGSFSVDLEVPDVNDGIYFASAEDESGNESATINFTVEENFSLGINPNPTESTPGYAGMDVIISGKAFKPSSQITISYPTPSQTVATTTSDSRGNFTASLSIPESPGGSHTITASDGANSLQVPFYMEADAPDTPTLSQPLSEGEAKPLAHFDWDNVADESLPVTYTLQVATSKNFTSTSTVLEKTGLTASEYTVIESEELEPRSAEAPYYWRVKAIDGASNESDWSGERKFYVAAPRWTVNILGFNLSVWAIIWWVVGLVVAGSVGYAVGRGGRGRSEDY